MKAIVIVSLCLSLSACSDKKSSNAPDRNEGAKSPQVQSPTVVTVEGEAITELDLELAVYRTLGPNSMFQADAKARQKILESIVMSKALALATQRSLSIEERYEIDRQTQAYRDELLAKRYLKSQVNPQPVTNEMVKAYYEANLEKYASPAKLQVEFVQAAPSMTPSQRGQVMAAMSSAQSQNDWPAWVSGQKAQGLPVTYSQNAFSSKAMASDVAQVVRQLDIGESSAVFFINKKPAIARVIKRIPGQATPLAQVTKEIRKTLAPIQLKKAIKAAAAEVMASMTIEYPEQQQ